MSTAAVCGLTLILRLKAWAQSVHARAALCLISRTPEEFLLMKMMMTTMILLMHDRNHQAPTPHLLRSKVDTLLFHLLLSSRSHRPPHWPQRIAWRRPRRRRLLPASQDSYHAWNSLEKSPDSLHLFRPPIVISRLPTFPIQQAVYPMLQNPAKNFMFARVPVAPLLPSILVEFLLVLWPNHCLYCPRKRRERLVTSMREVMTS